MRGWGSLYRLSIILGTSKTDTVASKTDGTWKLINGRGVMHEMQSTTSKGSVVDCCAMQIDTAMQFVQFGS